MRFYKHIENGYILGIGTGTGGTEITESEYNEIMAVIRNHPVRDGYGYRLKTDLTWEEYELPKPDPDDEISEEEAFDILTGGVI